MQSEFSDAVFQRLLAAIPATPPVTRSRLGKRDVPATIAHFLGQTLDRRMEIETAPIGETASSWVDPHLEEVQIGRAAYVRLLARHAHFPPEEWPGALRQATEFVTSHLVRPVTTLIHFIFGDGAAEVPTADVKRRAGYFMAYPHFGIAIESFLAKNPEPLVQRRDLADLLARVDRESRSNWALQDWLRSLRPLFDLAGSAGGDGIPLAEIESFFEARNETVLAARARAHARRNRTEHFDDETLRVALEPPPPPPPPAPAAPTTRPNLFSRGTGGAGATDAASAKDGALPLWQKFRSPAGEPDARKDAGKAAKPSESASQPLWKQFASTGATKPPDADLTTAESAVLGSAVAGRARFIRELFGGSEDEYRTLIDQLEPAPSWGAATKILAEQLFRKHRIDIYSKVAVDFTEAVEYRYRHDS